MSGKEHSTPALGDSEVASVKYPPGEAIPEVGQGCENEGKVAAVGRGEKPWDVLDQEPSWSKVICDPGVLEEQVTSVSVDESGSSAGDGDVLAGEPAAEKVNVPVLGA